MTQLAGEINRSGAACAKLESVLGEVRSNGVISIDIETYSPNGKPWETWADPIVSIAMVHSKTDNPADICLKLCFIGQPQSERDLLHEFIITMEEFDCPRIWYWGYGSIPRPHFDYPYLQRRATSYQLDTAIREAVDRQANYDVYDLAKHFFGKGPYEGLKMEEAERRLGIERTLPKSEVNGGNFHKIYDAFRSTGDNLAIQYNLEDAICNIRILRELSLRTVSPPRS